MGIKFQIFSTKLAGETRHVARIAQKDNYDQAMLVDRMMEMGTSVSRGDVESVLGLLQKTVERVCGEGSTVSLDGFVRFAPAIGGIFDSVADGYLSTRNSVYVNARVSSVFNNRFSRVTGVEKISASFKSPGLTSVNDLASDSSNKNVTPGNIVSLIGERLKFDPQNAEEYLRFVNAEDATQMVTITKFQKFTDKELVFLMPSVPFTKGCFELANALNTAKVRSDKSPIVDVVA